MSWLRALLRFVDRYVTLAGRNCCAGRAQCALDRSLARRTRARPPKTSQ